MKKVFLLFTMVLLLFGFGCTKDELNSEVKMIVPNGTPFICVGGLVGEKNVTIENVDGPTGLRAALLGNTYDIVIAPLNLGTQLYTKGNSTYVLDSVIAFGNTYIVSKSDVEFNSLKDLEGKTILAYSQGGVPDILLQYALKKEEVSATIEYQPSLAEVVPFFKNGNYDYILAAEPVISTLQLKQQLSIHIFDLQTVFEDTEIMQAAIFVNPNAKNQEDITKVIEKIATNMEEMNQNPSSYSDAILNKDTYFSDLGKDILTESIPRSNLKFMKAKDHQQKVEEYLTVLQYELPNNEFYRQ